MRVIAGRLGGRIFRSPPGNRTHPMGDRIRGALFNTLGDITGLTVLDAFAGSGALAIEAASRGAARTVAIEADRNAQKTISDNIAALGLGKEVKLIGATAGAWLATSDEQFDIVLCDPPYNAIQPELLAQLAERCRAGGIVVLSLPPEASVTLTDHVQLLSRKDYGDANLYFYRPGPRA